MSFLSKKDLIRAYNNALREIDDNNLEVQKAIELDLTSYENGELDDVFVSLYMERKILLRIENLKTNKILYFIIEKRPNENGLINVLLQNGVHTQNSPKWGVF